MIVRKTAHDENCIAQLYSGNFKFEKINLKISWTYRQIYLLDNKEDSYNYTISVSFYNYFY